MNVFEIFAKIGLDTSEYEQGLDDSEGKAQSFGAKLKSGLATAGKVAVGAVAAVGTAAVTAGTAFVKGAGDLAAYGDNIDKMSQKMGMSASAYQEWDAILQHSGTSIETMKNGMKTLAAAAETGNKAFDELGLSQEKIAGMSQEELFGETIKALQNVESETQRTYLASQLLGRGGTELGALLNTSAEDTEKMRQRVHELGGVMSDEAVKASAAYQDSLQDMTTAFAGVKRGIMSDFLPGITTVMDGLTEIFAGNGSGGVKMLTEGISTTIKKIQEAVPKIMDAGKKIFSSLFNALMENLPQIMQGGTELILQLVIGITETIPVLIPAMAQAIGTIVQTIWDNVPALIEAGRTLLTSLTQGMEPAQMIEKGGELLNGFLEKALEFLPQLLESGLEFVASMASGVSSNLPAIIKAITNVLTRVISTLMQSLPKFLQKGVEFVAQMANGVANNLPTIISGIVSMIVQLIATIASNLPQFLQKGIEMIGQMAAGLVSAIPTLVAKLPQLFSSIWSSITSMNWGSIGSNILDGIKNGVINAGSRLVEAAVQAVKNAFNAMKNFLGIQSPSKLARDVLGKNWALGIGEGFTRNMPTSDMVGAVEDTFSAMDEDPGLEVVSNTVRTQDAQLYGILNEILTAVREMVGAGVYLDGRELVGRIAPAIDATMGQAVTYKERMMTA